MLQNEKTVVYLSHQTKRKMKATQKIFKLISNQMGHKFSFNAKDIDDATAKAKDWVRYHSHSFSDYSVEETTEEKWMHNEYVN